MSGSVTRTDGHSGDAWVALARQRIMRTYPDTDVVFASGHGSWLVDTDGVEWLDFLSGIAVVALGHAHPAVTRAVAEQAATLVHASNLFLTTPALELAERLAVLAGWPDARVFFAQCGATANEAAIKLARRHGKLQHRDKVRIVTLEGSFHGRTLATLEATGQAGKHAPFMPLAGFVDTVAHDDPTALTAAVGADTCAVLLEVVQGEGGVRPLDAQMLAGARAACDAHGALLMVDEVQTGVGRTGSWFAFQQTDIVPDVMTLAKALGNGLPIGACIARGPAADALQPGEHATTFGGNPVTQRRPHSRCSTSSSPRASSTRSPRGPRSSARVSRTSRQRPGMVPRGPRRRIVARGRARGARRRRRGTAVSGGAPRRQRGRTRRAPTRPTAQTSASRRVDLALEILGTAIAEAFTAAGVPAPHATASRTS